MELKGWIARDLNGGLYLYARQPERDEECLCFNALHYLEIPQGLFPEVTWENSPQEVTIKIEKI